MEQFLAYKLLMLNIDYPSFSCKSLPVIFYIKITNKTNK